MSTPNNNPQARTTPPRRKSSPLGGLLAFILLLAAGAGLFFFLKNKQNDGSNLLSSLNLPSSNNQTNTTTSNEPSFTQTEPVNYSENNNASAFPSQTATKKAKSSKNKNRAKTHHTTNRVVSGYPMIAAKTKPYEVSNRQVALVKYQTILPKYGVIPGSTNSFIAYPNPENPLAIRPNQIITFQTNLYQKSQALNHAANRLVSLGFKKVQIPIDDYIKGGSTVVEGIDEVGNQAYFSFKPMHEGNNLNTAWKLEVYKR